MIGKDEDVQEIINSRFVRGKNARLVASFAKNVARVIGTSSHA